MADDDQYEDDDAPVSISAKDLKALRNIAKNASDMQKEFEAAQRQLAFAKAKIDVTDPKMSYFIKGYEGELDPEQIRAAATEAGFISGDQKKVEIPAQELSAHQTMGEAAAGSTPSVSAQKDITEMIRNAQSQEEVMAIVAQAGLPTSWNSQ